MLSVICSSGSSLQQSLLSIVIFHKDIVAASRRLSPGAIANLPLDAIEKAGDGR
jgi:hypothetical protein